MDAIRDNPEAAVHIFEGTHENPELIWNDNSREKVSTTVREMMLEYVKSCCLCISSAETLLVVVNGNKMFLLHMANVRRNERQKGA